MHTGPIFTKGLRLKVETFVSSFCPQTAKTFVLGLVVFTKNLRPVLGLAKGSTLRLVGSGLKFCKEDYGRHNGSGLKFCKEDYGRHKLFSTSKFEMAVNKV